MSFSSWARVLVSGTKPARRSSRPASRSRYYRPRLESLEDRSLLSAFATFQGELATPKEKDVIPIRVTAADFSRPGRTVLLGFEMHAVDDSQLDPARIQVQPQGRYAAARPSHWSNTREHSVTLAQLRPGSFQLLVSADRRTTGAYQINAFLVGDANGDSRVDKSDERLIQALRGKRLGNPAYVEDADANRDGIINKKDEVLARTNRGAATQIRPLTLSAAVDPATVPGGIQPGAIANVVIVGQTLPLAAVQLDQGGDGSFEQAGIADSQGHYQFTVGVSAGTTQFQVLARGPFSQHLTTDLDVIVPLTTPGQLALTLDQAHAASALITDVGGTVSTTALDGASYSLVIPSGSLINDQTISLTPVAAIGNLPLSGGLVAAVQFAPDGLQFPAPVTLTIDVPAAFDTNGLFGFTYDADGTNFQIVPVQVAGHTLTMQVSHFSGAGAATGNPADFALLVQPFLNEPQALSVTLVETLVIGLIGSWETQFPGFCDSTPVCQQAVQKGLDSLNFRTIEAFLLGLSLAQEPFLARNVVVELTRIEALRQRLGAEDRPAHAAAEPIVERALNQAGAEALVNPRLGTLLLVGSLTADAGIIDRTDLQQLGLEKLGAGLAKLFADAVAVCETNRAESLLLLNMGVDNFIGFLRSFDASLAADFESTIVSCPATITIAPSPASVSFGGQLQFTATVTGPTNTAVTWSLNSSTSGTIDAQTGLFTAGQTPDTLEVKATSVANTSKFATASITIANVAIAPASASVRSGEQLQFTATVSGLANTAVTWSVNSSLAGAIHPQTGLFTAGQNQGAFEVKATSVADNSKFATASITIEDVSVEVTPQDQMLAPGETLQFQASVTGLANQDVIWSTDFGTITQTGVLTANDAGPAGVITVTATSVASPTHRGTGSVVIPKVSIRPDGDGLIVLPPGGVQQFTAIVARLSNPAVTWSIVDLGGDTGSTITNTGFFRAGTRPGAIIVAAQSVEDLTQLGTVLISIPTVSVTPQQVLQIAPGQTQQFSATVLNADQRVIWTATGGNTIDPLTGFFTAGQNAGTFEVKATSVADPSKSDTASVTVVVVAPTSGTISPSPVTIPGDQSKKQQFTVAFAGLTNQNATWSVTGGGTITPTGGLFTSGNDGMFLVTATSVADPSVRATATVIVGGSPIGRYEFLGSSSEFCVPGNPGERFTLQISALSLPFAGRFRFTITRPVAPSPIIFENVGFDDPLHPGVMQGTSTGGAYFLEFSGFRDGSSFIDKPTVGEPGGFHDDSLGIVQGLSVRGLGGLPPLPPGPCGTQLRGPFPVLPLQ